MKAVEATFNKAKALVGAFSVVTNLRMDLRFKLYQPGWQTLGDTLLCPQAFVCQINLALLPGPVQEQLGLRAGLFQLFYCLECMPLYCQQDMAVLPPAQLVPSLKSQAARVAAR